MRAVSTASGRREVSLKTSGHGLTPINSMLRTGTFQGFRPEFNLSFWPYRVSEVESKVPVAEVGSPKKGVESSGRFVYSTV